MVVSDPGCRLNDLVLGERIWGWEREMKVAIRAGRTASSCATAMSREAGNRWFERRRTMTPGEWFPHRVYRQRQTIY
ncbi:MAG: hypothetical protein ACM3U2_20150 [Deltaproteobacteria bacterium]